MFKKIFFSFLVLNLLFFLSAGTILAQLTSESLPIRTKVGDPKTPQPGGSGNAPPVSGDIRQAIINTFGITMNDFDNEHLQWAWEKLWEISNTKFTDYAKGSIISISNKGHSEQTGCPNTGGVAIELKQWSVGDYFKFNLVHEFGHVIANCYSKQESKTIDFRNAFSSQGPISEYGRCTSDWSEDYAEMIAYDLTTKAGATNALDSCNVNRTPLNPFFGGGLTGWKYATFLNIVKGIIDK